MVILQADVPLQRAPSRIGKMAHRLAVQFDLDLGPTAAISDVFHWPRGFEASLEPAAN
jgi:hypothetical protein